MVLSIITAATAVLALFFTGVQIWLNNKQNLFDKRIDAYLKFKGIYDLYEQSKNLLEYKNEDEMIIVDFSFIYLTNNSYLKDIAKIIEEPQNNEFKTEFLLKIEEIKMVSNQMRLLFKTKYGRSVSEFVNQYGELLLELYKYQLLYKEMSENNFKHKEYKELQKEYGEKRCRERLYNTYKQIENSYLKLTKMKIIDKLEKNIRFVVL